MSKKVDIDLFALCDQAVEEKNTNKLSLVGIFNEFNISEFPSLIHRFFLYVKFSGNPGVYKVKMEIVAPKGKVIAKSGERELQIEEGGKFKNFIWRISPIVLPEEGIYFFKILVDGKVISLKEKHYAEAKKI